MALVGVTFVVVFIYPNLVESLFEVAVRFTLNKPKEFVSVAFVTLSAKMMLCPGFRVIEEEMLRSAVLARFALSIAMV
jgi:Na+/H+-dicarboxylate symporter